MKRYAGFTEEDARVLQAAGPHVEQFFPSMADRLIRQIPSGKDLPILLATAHAMEGDRERLLTASGASAYIEKPIYDPQVLISKIQELVAR